MHLRRQPSGVFKRLARPFAYLLAAASLVLLPASVPDAGAQDRGTI